MADDPPKRRWLSRSPNRSIIVAADDVSIRIGPATQRALRRIVIGKALKVAVPVLVAAVAALVAWLEVC